MGSIAYECVLWVLLDKLITFRISETENMFQFFWKPFSSVSGAGRPLYRQIYCNVGMKYSYGRILQDLLLLFCIVPELFLLLLLSGDQIFTF